MASEQPSGSGELAMLHVPSVVLADLLHEIAQPLTVLAALMAMRPALTGDHLATASRECHRAIEAVRSLQVLSSGPGEAVIDAEGPR